MQEPNLKTAFEMAFSLVLLTILCSFIPFPENPIVIVGIFLESFLLAAMVIVYCILGVSNALKK